MNFIEGKYYLIVLPEHGNQIYILDVLINIFNNCKIIIIMLRLNYFNLVISCKYSSVITLNVNYDNVRITSDIIVTQIYPENSSNSLYIVFRG